MNRKFIIIGGMLGVIAIAIGFGLMSNNQSELTNTVYVNDLTLLTDESVDEVKPTEVIQLQDGDTLDLVASIVKQKVGNRWVKRLAYNGQIPGPVLKVDKGAKVTVNFTNNLDMETALHSHGLRGDWKMDGAAPLSQDPIPVGGTFTYKLEFPDTGVFWYHPHVREDYQQEMGLYGNFIVFEDGYWNEVDQEEYLIVDDILENGDFKRDSVSHTLMGRFGDKLLINDTDDYQLEINQGEITRLFVTNVANTRTFKLAFPGAEVKLVGGDLGRVEQEVMLDDITLGTAERSIIEVYYPKAGTYDIEHRGQKFGEVVVLEGNNDRLDDFKVMRSNSQDYASIRNNFAQYLDGPADKNLNLTMEMDMAAMMGDSSDMNVNTNNEVEMGMENMMGGDAASDEAMREHCQMMPEMPGCEPYVNEKPEAKTYTVMGMQMTLGQAIEHCEMMPGMSECADLPKQSDQMKMNDMKMGVEVEHEGDEDGIEWEDEMAEMNLLSNTDNVQWIVEDTDTGAQNGNIDWSFNQGDMVKVNITNDADSMHPMQHPFHFHGQRFVVLSRNGEANDNLQWKDTVLIPTGQSVELLIDIIYI